MLKFIVPLTPEAVCKHTVIVKIKNDYLPPGAFALAKL